MKRRESPGKSVAVTEQVGGGRTPTCAELGSFRCRLTAADEPILITCRMASSSRKLNYFQVLQPRLHACCMLDLRRADLKDSLAAADGINCFILDDTSLMSHRSPAGGACHL